MLKHRSTEYIVMSPLTACVLVLAVMGITFGEKTEQEWLASIDRLMKDLSQAYKAGDESAIKELMTEDVHRFPPGHIEMVGVDEPFINDDGEFIMEHADLRAFCGNGAVSEFKITTENPEGGTRYGKGMALLIEDCGTIKFHSFIWNYDD